MYVLCPELTMSRTKNPAHFDWNTGIVICIMNGLVAIPTTALNLLLILSVLSSPSLRKPSYILICALAFTDFGVGFVVQPLYIARKIKFLTNEYDTYCLLLQVGNVFAHICCVPSVFIVTAISIDRYLAVSLRTAYNQRVTIKIVLQYLIFALFCTGCITYGRFQSTEPKYMSIAAAMMVGILSIILFCYFQSLKELKRVQRQITQNSTSTGRVSNSKHRNILATLIIIVTTLFCCYVPFVTVVLTMAVYGRSRHFMIAWEIGLTLLYYNSFLNPVVHFTRLEELRLACVSIFKRSAVYTTESAQQTCETESNTCV